MKIQKSLLCLLLALVLALSMAACAGNGGNASQPTDSTPTVTTPTAGDQQQAPEETDAPETEEYGTVVIENGDRTVTFTEMPQRVLCCNLYAAENMVMLGLGDLVVGKNVPGSDAEKPLEELADQFANIPEIEKSHENALGTECDLVIGQVSVFSESAWGSYDMFESKGINCLTITGTLVVDETVEDIYTDIRNLGKIFKIEDRAEALIADIQSKIEAVQEAVKDVTEDQKPNVFVVDSFIDNEIYTTSSGLESNLIELAGGVNCTAGMADSRWFTTSVETLIATNPDIIIINDYGSTSAEQKIEILNQNAALADVPAVKNQNYYVIPLVEVMQDMRAATACEKFAAYFYPDLVG